MADPEEEKAKGNALFKNGEYLKASACYTKAIKLNPNNHVYYSNRAEALLKLGKVNKALGDADKCVALAPDFFKGHNRRARALQLMGDIPASVEAALQCCIMEQNNREAVKLGISIGGKKFKEQLKQRRLDLGIDKPPPPEPPPPPPEPTPPPKPAAPPPQPVAAAAAPDRELDESKELWEMTADDFAIVMVREALVKWKEEGVVADQKAMAYVQPKSKGKELGCIGIEKAFTTPDNLMSCADFLLAHVQQEEAPAVVILVLKSVIEYPCVWKGKSSTHWKFAEGVEGVFVQLEAPKGRAVYFTELPKNGSVGETAELDFDGFGLFPPLFKPS